MMWGFSEQKYVFSAIEEKILTLVFRLWGITTQSEMDGRNEMSMFPTFQGRMVQLSYFGGFLQLLDVL